MASSKKDTERIVAAYALGSTFAHLPDKDQGWRDLHRLTQDKERNVRRGAARVLGSAFAHLPDKLQGWQDLHRLTQDRESYVRWDAARSLGSAFAHLPDKLQGWQDLHRLTQDRKSYVRGGAARVLGSAFDHLPDKLQVWRDLHRLTQDQDRVVRWYSAYALGSAFAHLLDKDQGLRDLLTLTRDQDSDVREGAASALGSAFAHLPDKDEGWQDLLRLTQDQDRDVRSIATRSLGSAFAHLPDKDGGWQDLHRLTQDQDRDVRLCVAFALDSAFAHLPDKDEGWQDLHRLTQDQDRDVRSVAALAIGSAFAHLPDKDGGWQDLLRLTQDQDSYVGMYAYHSLGRVSVHKASEADEKNTIRSELEAAVEFFEKSSPEQSYYNPAQFCRPFYRSYLALTFQCASEAEVKRYLAEAKEAVGSSENKRELLGAVENLAKALEETQKLKDKSKEQIQSDLKAYRWYCDRAAEHMAAAEDGAPGAVRLLRKCNPIIEERIEATIASIQKAAREICQVTRGSGTKYEAPGAEINREARSLSSDDPIKAFKSSTRIASILKEFCGLLPKEKRGHACEIVDEIVAEQDLSGRLSKIELALTYLQPNIDLAAHESATKNIFKVNSDTCYKEMGNLFRAIILTALKKEYLAVRAHLDDPKEETHKGTIYEVGKFSENGRVWDVAILEAGRYNERASFEAERAISHFHPNVAIFIGVAGGIHDVSLGDVVAATKVYGYEAGKAKDKFCPTPEIYRSSYILEQRARAVARNADWIKRIKGPNRNTLPNAYVESIAAGPKVVKSTRSDTYKFLRSNYSDAIAVEMEGLGFLAATHANQDVNAIIIRGISDLIDHKDEADSQGSQEVASQNASAFAFEVLAKLVFDDESKISSFNSVGSTETKDGTLDIINYDLYNIKVLNELTEEIKKTIGFHIPMSLTEIPIKFKFYRAHSKEDYKKESIFAEQALNDHRRMIILGDPGSGKSCLLNQLAIEIIKKSEIIPIIIKAKLWGLAFDTIPQAIKFVLKSYLITLDEDTITEELNKNKYLLLIDGFDEIRNPKRKVFFESEIISMIRNNTKIKLIITSRKADYHEEFPQMLEFEINKLSNAQIDEYARSIISHEFFSHHLADSNLLELARLPLYLFMLCKNVADGGTLPKNKAILHENFALDLLKKKRIPGHKDKYPLQSKMLFLSRLAEKRTNDPLYDNYHQCLNGLCTVDDAATFMQELLESGILKGDNTYFDFIHQTVREFFLARLISSYESSIIAKFLKNHHDNDTFLEIILLLVGIPKETEKQNTILDFLENKNLPLYIKCLEVRYINQEITDNYKIFEYNYLNQIQRSYNSILSNFFNIIKFRFYPYSFLPTDKVNLAKNMEVQVVGYIDVPKQVMTYGYKYINKSENSRPLIISEKSISPKFKDVTPFHRSTHIEGLDLDSAREIAIEDIKNELEKIIIKRGLIHPKDTLEIYCEELVADIKGIASRASKSIDTSIKPLWRFNYDIYDAKEYYDEIYNVKCNLCISSDMNQILFFELQSILARLMYLIKNDISLKEKVLPPYFLEEKSPLLGEDLEKRLALRLDQMYSILPQVYQKIVKYNLPKLQKYMGSANIYPFRCIIKYHYGIDLAKKGLIRDPLGEASLYFEPIPNGERTTAIVKKENPDISEEEQIKLSIEYKNALKSLGRYSKNNYFCIYLPSTTDIIDNLALTKAVYELINEDLEWLIPHSASWLPSMSITLESDFMTNPANI